MILVQKFGSNPVAVVIFALVVTCLLLSAATWDFVLISAQIPPAPSIATPRPPSNIPPPTVEITSHEDGQQVQLGELTIGGVSSDNKDSNCWVYADVNDITPMRNVSGIDFGDLSQWSFTYSEDYQLIREGSNELTAKISCFSPGNPIPLSEWHTVNVTGVPSTQEDANEDNVD